MNLKEKINNYFDLNLIGFIKQNKFLTSTILASACIIGISVGYFCNQQPIEEKTIYTSKLYASLKDNRTQQTVLQVHDLQLDIKQNKHKLKDATVSFNFYNERNIPINYLYITISVFDKQGNQIADNGKYSRSLRCRPVEVINNFYRIDEISLTDFYDISKVEVAIEEILYEDDSKFILNTPAISSITILDEPIKVEDIMEKDNINKSIGEKI